ncbi:MAG: RecX family transcriptional regulator [Candidatus Gracilibacteria bacterium]|nr:RecX family transcriptional regulator [Candidatus Gracilibacteria bacterium]
MPRILTRKEPLMNYAAWYAMRYLPSMQKLRESLLKKSGNNALLTEDVIQEMTTYIHEEQTVEGLVRMYTEQSKTRPYIEQKLRQKKFEAGIIASILDSYADTFMSWKGYEQTVTKKIRDYREKNKSGKYVRGVLIQKYPNFKREIGELLEEIYFDEADIVRTEYEKLSKKHDISNHKERQKIVQKLCLKGFAYEDIKRVIREKE